MSTQRNDLPGPVPNTPTKSVLQPPPWPEVPLPDVDARTHALNVLSQWFSSLVFRRTMAPGQPSQPFSITRDRVFIEQPDNVEGLQFPAIGIMAGRGQYLTRGLGGAEPDDESATVDGLALLVPFDYAELLTIEGWGSKIAERRSIIAAIETAMGSYEGTTDLRLVMPDYFGLVATFSLMERENIDDLEVQRGRRRVHIYVQMTVPVVVEARFATLNTSISLNLTETSALSALGFGAIVAALKVGDGLAGLKALGLTLAQAKTIARATLGVTVAQANAFSAEYLCQVCLSLAVQQAKLETWKGRPPYSPGETEAALVVRGLPHLSLP